MTCLRRVKRDWSQGHEALFWEAPSGAKLSRAFEMRDSAWGTHSVTLGWDRQGIWPVGSSGSEVTCVDVSGGKGGLLEGGVRRILTGDTLGHVKLFRYPSVGASSYKSYIGHGGTVSDVRFSSDGKRAWSVGGRDCCLFQWQHIAKFPDEFRTPKNDENLL